MMDRDLDDELNNLAGAAPFPLEVLENLFEGWDIIDFNMVKAAIQETSTSVEWQQSLDALSQEDCEDWAQAWETRLVDSWHDAGCKEMSKAVTALRRLLLVTDEAEFSAIAEAFQIPLTDEEESRGSEYLTGMTSKFDLSRTVRNNVDRPESLFAVHNIARFDTNSLAAAEKTKRRFPNACQVIDGLLAEMRRGFEFGDDAVTFRPTIILGKAGVGKTTVVRDMLGALGMAPEIVSVAGHTDSQVFGVSAGWSSAMPSVMTNAVLKQKILNPVLVLDEIDKVRPGRNGDIYAELLLLTEPTDAKTYRDKFLSTNTDCSRMSWLFTANDLERVPEPLKNRCVIYRMSPPTEDQLPAVIRSMHRSYAKERSVDPRMVPLSLEDFALLKLDYLRHEDLRRLREMIRILVHLQQKELPRA